MKLDPLCIILSGYLVKSPPLEKTNSRFARWKLRWFVLYDSKCKNSSTNADDSQDTRDREVDLIYYKCQDTQMQGDAPLGIIHLDKAKQIYVRQKAIQGYHYVMEVETTTRMYHLCCTDYHDFKKWVDTIEEVTNEIGINRIFKSPEAEMKDKGGITRCSSGRERISHRRVPTKRITNMLSSKSFRIFSPTQEEGEEVVQVTNNARTSIKKSSEMPTSPEVSLKDKEIVQVTDNECTNSEMSSNIASDNEVSVHTHKVYVIQTKWCCKEKEQTRRKTMFTRPVCKADASTTDAKNMKEVNKPAKTIILNAERREMITLKVMDDPFDIPFTGPKLTSSLFSKDRRLYQSLTAIDEYIVKDVYNEYVYDDVDHTDNNDRINNDSGTVME